MLVLVLWRWIIQKADFTSFSPPLPSSFLLSFILVLFFWISPFFLPTFHPSQIPFFSLLLYPFSPYAYNQLCLVHNVHHSPVVRRWTLEYSQVPRATQFGGESCLSPERSLSTKTSEGLCCPGALTHRPCPQTWVGSQSKSSVPAMGVHVSELTCHTGGVMFASQQRVWCTTKL